MASNQLSSTNIAEILESQIEAMKNINDVIVGAQLDEAMLKNIVDTVKPMQDVIIGLTKIADEMSKLKISDVLGTIKFKLSVKGLVSNLKYIAEELGNLEVDKKAGDKTKAITESISGIAGITGDLTQIGMASVILVAMKPMIVKTIRLIVEISKELSEMEGDADPKRVVAIGDMLSALGKSLLVFVLATMGGIVPLMAIASLLAVKAFLWVFVKLFSKEMFKDLQISIDGMKEIGKAIAILSLTIVLMVLTGLLVIESWREIIVTMLFVAMAIGLFALLGLASRVIKDGEKSLTQISLVLVILSLTVLLWALTGELIAEESKNIWMTVMFVGVAIALFFFLGLAGNIIKTGGKTILLVALSLVILSLTVLLWAETGDFVTKNWESVAIMAIFVGVAIGLFALLGWASKTIKEGALSILAVAGTLFILTLVVLLWASTGGYVLDHWVEVLVMSGFVLIAIGLFFLLGMAMSTITQGGASVLLMAVSLAVLGATALLFIYTGQQIMENWVALLITLGFVVLVIGIVTALAFAAPYIAPGIAALIFISGGLLIFSVAMLIIGAAAKMYTFETVALIMGILGGLSVVVAGMGLAFPLIALGSVALTLLGVGLMAVTLPMLVFAGAIKAFKSVDAKPEDVSNIVGLMASLVWSINDAFGFWGVIGLIRAAAKVRLMAPIAAAVGTIASVMQQIASLNMPTKFDKDGNPIEFKKMTYDDFREAAVNGASIVSILANMFGDNPIEVEIGGKKVMIDPISMEALERIDGSKRRKMWQLASITSAIGSMASVLQNMASLRIPDFESGFDENGNPKNYRQMTTEDFILASQNAASLALLLVSIFDEEGPDPVINGVSVPIVRITDEMLDNITRGVRRKIERLAEVTTAIGSMASVIQNVASMNLPTKFNKEGKPTDYRPMTEQDFENSTKNVIKIMTELLNAVGSPEISQTLEELDSDAAENFAIIMNSVGGVMDLVNAIKTASEFDEEMVGKGISRMSNSITAYIGMIQDLFVGKTRKEWASGFLGFPYLRTIVVEAPQIDEQTLEDAKDAIEVVIDSINQTMPIIDNLKKMDEDSKDINSGRIGDIMVEFLTSIVGDENGQGGIPVGMPTFQKIGILGSILTQQERLAAIKKSDLKENTETFIKFVDKANSIDTSKLKSVRDMFEQLARFSESVQGDFDKLADVLSEKLVDILDKLNTTIENVQSLPAPATTDSVTPATPAVAGAAAVGKQGAGQDKQSQAIDRLIGYIDGIEGALNDLNTTVTTIKNRGVGLQHQ